MASPTYQNSYSVLGLKSTATQKDILRRSKEFSHKFLLQEEIEIEDDLDIIDVERNEESLKRAVQRLTSPGERVEQYFFWFSERDSNDEKALDQVRNTNYEEALSIWQESATKETKSYSLKKRNIALLYLLLLHKEANPEYVHKSLALWKEILESEKFWEVFEKDFYKYDELGSREDVVRGFRSRLLVVLSDIYSELSQKYEDISIVREFSKVFGDLKGESAKKQVLTPAFEQLQQNIDRLKMLKVSEDGILDKEETKIIKEILSGVEDNLNQLIDLGLYETSRVRDMRDQVANAIYGLILEIHNDLGETKKALTFMEVALQIAGTESLKGKIEKEIKTIRQNLTDARKIEPIEGLIGKENYDGALELIKAEEKRYKEHLSLQDYYRLRKRLCVTAIALKKHKTAHELFDSGAFDDAKNLFEENARFIDGYIEVFNFNEKVIREIISDVKRVAKSANTSNLSQVDEYRMELIGKAQKTFGDVVEESAVLVMIIDANLFGTLSNLAKDIKKKNNVANVFYVLGWLTVWFYGLGIIFFVIGWAYKQSNSSKNDE